MTNLLRLLVPLSLGTTLVAQSLYVQPIGYDTVEGNSSSGIPFSYVSSRVQQADSNQIGNVLPSISALRFRRDRSASSTTATARTVDVTVLMGKCDISAFTATFASNWLTPPTTVYTQKPTNLPDITTAPPAPPAAFAIPIVLDAPFFYDGVDSLLWEIQVDAGVTGTYSMDWVSAATNTTGATSTALGTGCTTANGVMSLTTSFRSTATDLELSFSTLRAPSNAPLSVLVGISDPALAIPGFCATIHTDAIASIPLGVSGATGSLSSALVSFPWTPSLTGWNLYSQVFAPDASIPPPGFPLAFSNGRQSPLPLTAGGPAPTGYRRTFSTSSSSAVTGSAPSTSAVVTEITY
jgi:hypothetical protein